MVKRQRKAVLRYKRFDPLKDDGEELFYSTLVLFCPFREEADLALDKAGYPSYKAFLEDKKDEIGPVLLQFEAYAQSLTDSFDELDKKRQEALAARLAANEDANVDEDEPGPAYGIPSLIPSPILCFYLYC